MKDLPLAEVYQLLEPGPVVLLMSLLPVWPKLKASAHTIAYDFTILAQRQRGLPLPGDVFGSARMPVLAAVGGKSPQWMKNAVRAVADRVPDTRHEVLRGQTHTVKPRALAPVLARFFLEER